MGIKVRDTALIHLMCTPVENLKTKSGRVKIAFNIPNIGRFKLGRCVGGMKLMVHESVRYANERHQFGK
jgi:alkylation response protein AidB-like acyl-CoA dehydrogenase